MRRALWVSGAFALVACGSSGSAPDAPIANGDAASDAASDAANDAANDGSIDAALDAPDPIPPFMLAVTRTGGGRVEGGGLVCADACEATFGTPTSVTLTAIADQDSVFVGWTGDCAGTAPCTLTVDRVRRVAATFGSCRGAETRAVRMGGTRDDTLTAIDASSNGTVVVAGTFQGQLGSLASAGGDDGLVIVYAAGGAVAWTRALGSFGQDAALAVAFAPNGDVVVGGRFEHVITLDGMMLISTGLGDGFVARLDGVTGSVLWLRAIGGPYQDEIRAVDVASNGTIAIAGSFGAPMTVASTPLSTAGSVDGFVAVLDPAGSVQWARRMGGTGLDRANGVAIAPSGDVIVVGTLASPTADFDGSPWIGASDPTGAMPIGDAFVAAWTSAGALRWTRELGDIRPDDAAAVAVAANGDVFVAGTFAFVPDFQGNPVTSGLADSYLARFSSAGTLAFARRIAADPTTNWAQSTRSLALDALGHVYLAGWFSSDAKLGGARVSNAGAGRTRDAFLVELTTDGDHVWSQHYGGAGDDILRGVAFAGGVVHAAGSFEKRLDACASVLDSAGGRDAVLVSALPPGTGAPTATLVQPVVPVMPPVPPLLCQAPPAPPPPPTITGGAPVFEQRPLAMPLAGGAANTFLVFDLDGDLDEDFYYTEGTDGYGSARAFLYRNDGTGVFTDVTASWLADTVARVDTPGGAVAFDADGDSRPEIVQSSGGYDAFPFPGGQDRCFSVTASATLVEVTGERLPLGPSGAEKTVPLDLECDGDTDLYANRFDHRVALNDGAGRFTLGDRRPEITDPHGFFQAVACDVDRDGDPDVIVGDDGPSPMKNYLLRNDGRGRFSADDSALPAKRVQNSAATVLSCRDLDRDGWPDVIGIYQDPGGPRRSLVLWLNNANGTFRDATTTHLPVPLYDDAGQYLEVADFNGDGWPDVVTSGINCDHPNPIEARLLLNQGSATFVDIPSAIPALGVCHKLFLIRADGDSRPDLARINFAGVQNTILVNVTP